MGGDRSKLVILLLLAAAHACERAKERPAAAPEAPPAVSAPTAQEPAAEAAARAALDRDFPLHGLVTGLQLKIRAESDPEAETIGWLRMGSRVRLARDPVKTKTCASGWHRIAPRGWACLGEGIEASEAPVESELALNPPARDAALPYAYFFVKEPKVPEYHRMPSRDDQRAVRDFAARYAELAAKSEERAARFLRGELAGESTVPPVVKGWLERGFFVAGAAVEERAFRKFVRTVRGSYVKAQQLEARTGSSFHGVELGGEATLPVAWAIRDGIPFTPKTRPDGTLALVTDEGSAPVTRLARVDWVGHERVGEQVFHKLADGRYLKHWFLAVAQKIERPREIGADETWIHVNLDQQTLVSYRGDAPVYATLVSTGLEGHDTPTGLFEIRAKHVAETMSDLGPDAGDERYKIEDVPWTQYFQGSLALHGAFWHERFGLRRSHGCINLAPLDAHRLFEHTEPEVPAGWHGVAAGPRARGAKVWVTEK